MGLEDLTTDDQKDLGWKGSKSRKQTSEETVQTSGETDIVVDLISSIKVLSIS